MATLEEKEYREWIKRNRDLFINGDYTLRQMVELSLTVGWKLSVIKHELRYWPRILHTDRRDIVPANARLLLLDCDQLVTIEMHKRRNGPCLEDSWKELVRYLDDGEFFREDMQ